MNELGAGMFLIIIQFFFSIQVLFHIFKKGKYKLHGLQFKKTKTKQITYMTHTANNN